MKARILCGLLALAMLIGFMPGLAVTASADSSMTTSESAVSLIKEFEGFSATAYWDNTQWSIGYGTRSSQGATITLEEAHTAMLNELAEVETALNSFLTKYGLSLSQNQFDALASLSYNCGTKWMTSDGRLRQAVTAGQTGNEFLFAISLWANIASVPNAGLLKRRMSEANLYLNGTYSKNPPANYTYVILNPNGGTPGHSGEDKMQAFCTDTFVSLMADNPTRTGYTFNGWYTATSGGEKVESLSAAVAGKTLYAQWLGADGTVATEKAIDTGTVKCGTYVNIRSGAGTNYPTAGSAKNGDKVNIYEKKTVGTTVWGRIDGGWISLEYVTLDSSPSGTGSDIWNNGTGTSSGTTTDTTTTTAKTGVVTGNGVNVRKAAGVNSPRVTYLNKGAKVTVYEQTTVGSTPWGRIGTDQWICMNYVKLDSDSTTSGSTETTTGTTGKVNATSLNVRSGAGTNYSRVGTLSKGASVTVYEKKTVGSVEWGRIGTNRWVSLTYVTMDGSNSGNNSGNSGIWNNGDSSSNTTTGKTGVVTGNGVNVRKAAGVNNARVTYLNKGAKVTVYEETTVSGVKWGRIGTDQWICMTYVKLDSDSGSSDNTNNGSATDSNTGVVTTGLNVRSGAGTNYAKVGSLKSGDKVTIYETRTVGTTKWGRIGTNRWVSLTYVKLNGSSDTTTDNSNSTAEPGKGTVTTTLNVRSGAGTNYTKVGTLASGTAVTITETKNVNGVSWGLIGTNRWICMTYVKMDSASTGSTGSSLWA